MTIQSLPRSKRLSNFISNCRQLQLTLPRKRWHAKNLIVRLVCRFTIWVSITAIGVVIVWKAFDPYKKYTLGAHQRECSNLSIRQEWRTLNFAERTAYISSVQCLMHHPSMFRQGTSYYDDFILAHSLTGSYSHYAAAFLPWHRLYMFVYEQGLRQKCGYRGPFP